ncbi:helix-turn-helix domain-containing protein [Dehalococcoides mccartyi]|jgi:transcriptional regulator with XRE-family HTH domain|uniref:helix-turn-helix domain-containing protein n=1 Tax=Dehalococcoides mccartyi TaxID=61435 RepID=UPI0004E034C7|nr:helix-turn-helix domain-containing protein [Dehalococcoides mccartyi]AII57385.1 XRE family transcriptional regulator [Dehalococcoides mccartyi CG1]
MNDFGEYLRKLREAQKLSLREMAAKTGVSVSYITQIENGKRKAPGPEVLKKLAPAYNVPVRDLLKAAGYLDDIKEVKSILSDEEEVERAFNYVIGDPRYQSGTRVTGPITTEVKRFVVEMYEKATGKKLLPGE